LKQSWKALSGIVQSCFATGEWPARQHGDCLSTLVLVVEIIIKKLKVTNLENMARATVE